jgi:hypothetical protein
MVNPVSNQTAVYLAKLEKGLQVNTSDPIFNGNAAGKTDMFERTAAPTVAQNIEAGFKNDPFMKGLDALFV